MTHLTISSADLGSLGGVAVGVVGVLVGFVVPGV